MVDVDLARSVRLIRLPFIPGGYQGITLGRFIGLTVDVPLDGSSTLLAHELVHVRQWRERGSLGFLRWYLGGFVRNLWRTRNWRRAYRDNPAEVEARAEASAWNAVCQFEPPPTA